MRTILKSYVGPGLVGGALTAIPGWISAASDITGRPLDAIGEAAVAMIIHGVAGMLIGLVFGVLVGVVMRLRGMDFTASSGSNSLAVLSVALAGGAVFVYSIVGGNTLFGSMQFIAAGSFFLIAIGSVLEGRYDEGHPELLLARAISVVLGVMVFGVGMRGVDSGALPFGRWGIVIAVVAAAVFGYVCWWILGALLRAAASKTSSGLITGVGVAVVIVALVGFALVPVVSWSDRALVQEAIALDDAETGGDQPNIILISVDTLRADSIGYAGGSVRTPVMDALADESYVFEKAYSVAPWTRPSFAAFFSSRYPAEMGVARVQGLIKPKSGDYIPYRWRADRELLAEIFQKRGYTTAGIVTNFNVTQRARANQGFDLFVHAYYQRATPPPLLVKFAETLFDPPPAFTSVFEAERADSVNGRALRFLDHNDNRPLLLWLHYMDPHDPYDPPSIPPEERITRGKLKVGSDVRASAARHMYRRAYREEVEYFDTWLGQLIERLKADGIWDNSIVVFWSDHGEEFWEHNGWGHMHCHFNEVLQVPLLIHLPGQTESKRISRPVSLMDPMPTILDYCDAPEPPDMRGQSLLGLMEGRDSAAYDFEVFAEGWLRHEYRKALINERYKLVYHGYRDDFSLYDLKNDPEERNDIYGTPMSPDTTEMEEKLRGWVDESQALMHAHLSANKDVGATGVIEKNLQDMGYIQ